MYMGDVFIEHIVKKKPSVGDMMAKVGIVAAFILVSVIILMFLPFGPLFVLVLGFGALYAMSFFNIEYEYIFTNGELDIDAIYSKSRRKRLFSAEIKPFEIMCHISEMSHNSMFAKATARKDYSSGLINERTYMFLSNYKGQKLKITFEPSDEMLKSFRPYLGSRLILQT
jgi:hypothetical protein